MLGTLEKEVMEIIWSSKEPQTVRTVQEKLLETRKVAYTTIMTIMNRLVEKKVLKRVQKGKAFIYKSSYTKEKFLTKVSQQIIRSFVSSFGEAAIAHFVEEVEKIPHQKKEKLLKSLKESQDV